MSISTELFKELENLDQRITVQEEVISYFKNLKIEAIKKATLKYIRNLDFSEYVFAQITKFDGCENMPYFQIQNNNEIVYQSSYEQLGHLRSYFNALTLIQSVSFEIALFEKKFDIETTKYHSLEDKIFYYELAKFLTKEDIDLTNQYSSLEF